ncbi:hypothetical protein BDP27DRAFT_519072 [Rhodocollybia butyracea]|uniref:Uncharacterized protein n=1 Tax=Rhodocollybia butyracea TaxID=206335 RepID=A0A9P5PWX9_9AGAR|nr:hypothetical protein BDP27DRAFT_519072 [Rhodocollybia butyracea]
MLFTPRSLGFVGLLAAFISSACAAPMQTSVTPASKSTKSPATYRVTVVDINNQPVENVELAQVTAITTSLNAIEEESKNPAPIIEYQGAAAHPQSDSGEFWDMVFYHAEIKGGDSKGGDSHSPHHGKEGFGYVVLEFDCKFGLIVTGGSGEKHWVIPQITRPVGSNLTEEFVATFQIIQYRYFAENFPPVKAWHPRLPDYPWFR